MLVEDDPSMLSILRLLLEMEGYEVSDLSEQDELTDISQIIESIRQEMPVLLLLDVHLNQLNGFDLLRNLRKDPLLRKVRIIMSSGMELTEECKREGADGFLLKPYMPEELLEKIRKYVAV